MEHSQQITRLLNYLREQERATHNTTMQNVRGLTRGRCKGIRKAIAIIENERWDTPDFDPPTC